MRLSLRFLLKSLLLCVGFHSFAQTSTDCKAPIGRQMWHDKIDREQKSILNAFRGGSNEDVNYHVRQAVSKKVDGMQCSIELDSASGDQVKKRYLSGIEKILRHFATLHKGRQFNASHFPSTLDLYERAMAKDIKKENIASVLEPAPHDVHLLVLMSDAFIANQGYKVASQSRLRKFCELHPEQIFSILREHTDLPFRDSLIRVAGYKFPKRLYDYAAANNSLGYAIRAIDDPLIKAVSKMAKSGSGQLYFPFLDNFTAGTITFDEIDAIKNDEVKYFKLLVKTRQEYWRRSLDGEKVVSLGVLDTMLQTKAVSYFIKTINELHDEQAPVRFRILNDLSAQELYYLVVAGEKDMYTSSYVSGIYPLMMQRAGNRGDSLLMSVTFDRFKKFIRVAAGYNTLSDFLHTIPDGERAQALMTAFVNGLEKSSGLEDGVDVADSYASIAEYIKPVADEMLKNVKYNYDRNVKENNKRGIVIYNLLYKLFLSADSTKGIDLSKEFGIPPVYQVNYGTLVEPKASRVVMQVFFYGDKDGAMNWRSFVPQFNNANWKREAETKYWIAFSTTKGKPMTVYANKFFDEEKQVGELEKAQEELNRYLADNGIEPTVVVHRGHSYTAPYTIAQIKPSAKVVLLGSCGGYNVISSVLNRAPDAHIVASKQTGKKDINQPLIDLLNDKLRNGSNIDWVPFWREFRTKAGHVEGFDDYVPPYKNLGAIFIKAYNSSMGEGNLL